MLTPSTLSFCLLHANDDVRMLALRGCPADVDLKAALTQIEGRQTARRKIPSWAEVEGVEYPPKLSMEQCSGEAAARYKAAVARRVLPDGGAMADLTGGLGVDFFFLSEHFDKAVYLERNEQLFRLASHNFATLGRKAVVLCGEAEGYLELIHPVDLLFLDPARRDAHGGRTYALADCTPDVTVLAPLLREKARVVMLKLSPMLDWRKAVSDLGGNVSEVHVVSVGGECKDLLLVLTREPRPLQLYCVSDGRVFIPDMQAESVTDYPSWDDLQARPLFVYEPNASVMKAGCFDAVAQAYGVRPLSHDSHLMVSPEKKADFPGRCLRVMAVTTMNKRELRAALGHLHQANITVRNFPLSAAELRHRLKISEGGSETLFATTLADGKKAIIISQFDNLTI